MDKNLCKRVGDFKVVNRVRCIGCHGIINTFDEVTNAWQKGDYNYYDSKCPKCSKITTVAIKIQDD